MSSNYQINLTVNAISKFNDLEKQFKKSLNNLSKISDNTSATLNKQTQKAFNSRLKQLKDLNDVEIQGLKKKNKLSESVLKNQSLNQAIANSLLKTKGDLEIDMTKKASKALDEKNKKDLKLLDKKNKLIEKTNQEKFEKASLDRLGSAIVNKQKEMKLKKEEVDLLKKQLDVEGKITKNKKAQLDLEGSALRNENARINAKRREEDRKYRQMYARSRFYEDVGRTGFYYGTLPATIGAGVSLRNAMTIADQERSLKLFAKDETSMYRKLAEDIASKTSLDIQSANRLTKGILAELKSIGVMNFDQASKIIKDIAMVSSSFASGAEDVEKIMNQYQQGAHKGYFSTGEDIKWMRNAGLAFMGSEYKKIFGKEMQGNIPTYQINKIFEKVAQRPEVMESYLQRQKELSGSFDQFNNNLLLASASLGDFIDKQYGVSEKLNSISNVLDSTKQSFYRMLGKEKEKPTIKDYAVGGVIKGIGNLLLAPLVFLASGYATKLYANYIRGNVGKVFSSKVGIVSLALPLITNFNYLGNILKDFKNDGLLPAITKNFVELATTIFLLTNPLGRLIVLFKTLSELIPFLFDKVKYIIENFDFDLIKSYVKDTLGGPEYNYGIPTNTLLGAPQFDNELIMQRKVNQAEAIATAVEKGSKKGTEAGMKEATKNLPDYSKTGLPMSIPEKDQKNNVRIFPFGNASKMSFGKNNPYYEY